MYGKKTSVANRHNSQHTAMVRLFLAAAVLAHLHRPTRAQTDAAERAALLDICALNSQASLAWLKTPSGSAWQGQGDGYAALGVEFQPLCFGGSQDWHWGLHDDPCGNAQGQSSNWLGITCDEAGVHITAIDLHQPIRSSSGSTRGLVVGIDALPESMSVFTRLRWFHSGYLPTTLPASLCANPVFMAAASEEGCADSTDCSAEIAELPVKPRWGAPYYCRSAVERVTSLRATTDAPEIQALLDICTTDQIVAPHIWREVCGTGAVDVDNYVHARYTVSNHGSYSWRYSGVVAAWLGQTYGSYGNVPQWGNGDPCRGGTTVATTTDPCASAGDDPCPLVTPGTTAPWLGWYGVACDDAGMHVTTMCVAPAAPPATLLVRFTSARLLTHSLLVRWPVA